MELSDYIRILRKNWLVIVVLTLLGLGAAAGYSLTRTPIYESASTVFVSTQSGNTAQELQRDHPSRRHASTPTWDSRRHPSC